MEKWLITGGCGFIGLNLIKHLIKQGGVTIRIVDNLSVGSRERLRQVVEYSNAEPDEEYGPAGSVQLVVGDVTDMERMKNITRETDVVVHLAANTGVPKSVDDPQMDFYQNVEGTFVTLEAARYNKVKRFIFASSGAPAGICVPPITEQMPPRPISPYGASKLAGEGYCSAYYGSYGIETVALRFSNVYGPLSGHKTSVVAKFINEAIQNSPWIVYGDGSQTRDFLYIDDLVQAIVQATTVDDVGGEVFQIATGVEVSVQAMLEKLSMEMVRHGYKGAEVQYHSPRKGDVMRNYSDVTKANTLLKWKAETTLEEGLAKTLEWFCKS
ncbi:NAD-dependent epimerase/dehydratase family protein [Desulfovibrio oxyclinae]|uniref:NAD-dependent epimerase/dehydratase family protein n=1 Tax=Desulfovibrio oxyclinae TaxID=63560 RepID=UPI0003679CB4|nr:NAD-dependent epimerase/dehydratase family protein [Desulfovibrio oxyclinae]